MLEEQKSVLSHIMDNILQDRHQRLSQTNWWSLPGIIYVYGWAGLLMQFVGGSYESESTQHLWFSITTIETTNGPY
jgi:hypothetical protein